MYPVERKIINNNTKLPAPSDDCSWPRLCKNTNPKKIVGRETLPDTEKIEYSSI
ncbi:hypothetical protein CPter291_1845 [Collimonas pratensis]|uniref:Uncharacterized protein n=1 Tax=Collimonas pratensis TaxID=279113 RepID=A0ABM5Z4N6_9BURK|nr:hypothetical protein CPter291_1845 [Collimonas pratensis]